MIPKNIGYHIQSKYLKNKIKQMNYQNPIARNYIDKLIFLERGLTKGIVGMAGNIQYHNIKNAYEKEYEAILKDLHPKRYQKYKKKQQEEEKKRKQQEKQWEQEEIQQRKQEQTWWKKQGGINQPKIKGNFIEFNKHSNDSNIYELRLLTMNNEQQMIHVSQKDKKILLEKYQLKKGDFIIAYFENNQYSLDIIQPIPEEE